MSAELNDLAEGDRLTAGQLAELAAQIQHVPVSLADRRQMAIGLFLQGYTAGRAAHLAYVDLGDDDGALQMLARHRLAASQ